MSCKKETYRAILSPAKSPVLPSKRSPVSKLTHFPKNKNYCRKEEIFFYLTKLKQESLKARRSL